MDYLSRYNIYTVSYTHLLDISGAFDNAWWPFVLYQLRRYNCPQYLQTLIRSYLTDREVVFEMEGARRSKTLTKGCPQGSILGPILWNVIFEDLLRQDYGDDVHIVAYADDAMLIVGGRSRTDLVEAAEPGKKGISALLLRASSKFIKYNLVKENLSQELFFRTFQSLFSTLLNRTLQQV